MVDLIHLSLHSFLLVCQIENTSISSNLISALLIEIAVSHTATAKLLMHLFKCVYAKNVTASVLSSVLDYFCTCKTFIQLSSVPDHAA